jgi:PAS domain-containing protein
VAGHTHHILDYKHDETFFQTFYEQLLKTVSAGESYRTEIVNRRKDGTEFPVYLSTSPIRDADGNVLVNDPAIRSAEKGMTRFHPDDVEKIWLAHGGVGYVLRETP